MRTARRCYRHPVRCRSPRPSWWNVCPARAGLLAMWRRAGRMPSHPKACRVRGRSVLPVQGHMLRSVAVNMSRASPCCWPTPSLADTLCSFGHNQREDKEWTQSSTRFRRTRRRAQQPPMRRGATCFPTESENFVRGLGFPRTRLPRGLASLGKPSQSGRRTLVCLI